MRSSLIAALLLVASCSPPRQENTAGSTAGPAAVVMAISGAGEDCSIRWNGETIPRELVVDNSVKLIMRTIEELGGVDRVTEENMPYLRLEAAGDTRYSCTGPILREMERAGFAHVVLKRSAGPGADQRANFPLLTDVPGGESAILRLEKGGRMSWDGEAIDRTVLRERARLARAMSPPVNLFVAPSADSDFTTLHDALRTIEREKMHAFLSGCAGTSGPIRETSPVC